jgi:hypothetical protein
MGSVPTAKAELAHCAVVEVTDALQRVVTPEVIVTVPEGE